MAPSVVPMTTSPTTINITTAAPTVGNTTTTSPTVGNSSTTAPTTVGATAAPTDVNATNAPTSATAAAAALSAKTTTLRSSPNTGLKTKEEAQAAQGALTADDDGSTRTLDISTELDFDFFPNQGVAPTTTEINALVKETERFFTKEVFQTQTGFFSFNIVSVVPKFDDESDRFELDFHSQIVMDKTLSKMTNQEAATLMSRANYNEYIKDYVWFDKNSAFYQTNVVHFVGRGQSM